MTQAENSMRQKFFDACAQGWEARNYSPELKQQVADMLSGLGIGEALSILDVGCGQGVLLPFLRQLTGPSGRLIALDASAAMLEGVAERDSQTLAIHASAEKIPLIDSYVDFVICFAAFPHFSDKAAAAREFFRVLKPGGKAYVMHAGSRESINRHHARHEAVAADCLPCERGMRALFTEAGFGAMELDEGDTHYCFFATKQADGQRPTPKASL